MLRPPTRQTDTRRSSLDEHKNTTERLVSSVSGLSPSPTEVWTLHVRLHIYYVYLLQAPPSSSYWSFYGLKASSLVSGHWQIKKVQSSCRCGPMLQLWRRDRSNNRILITVFFLYERHKCSMVTHLKDLPIISLKRLYMSVLQNLKFISFCRTINLRSELVSSSDSK